MPEQGFGFRLLDGCGCKLRLDRRRGKAGDFDFLRWGQRLLAGVQLERGGAPGIQSITAPSKSPG